MPLGTESPAALLLPATTIRSSPGNAHHAQTTRQRRFGSNTLSLRGHREPKYGIHREKELAELPDKAKQWQPRRIQVQELAMSCTNAHIDA